MGMLMFSARVYDLLHYKADLQYRLNDITRRMRNLTKFAQYVGNTSSDLTPGDALGVGAMMGRAINYMGFAHNYGVGFVQQYGPYYQQMMQQQMGNQIQTPEQAQFWNQYIQNELYKAGREKAQKIAEAELKKEEEKIEAEREKCKTLLDEVEAELKAAREARDKGIQDMAPKYVAG